MGGAEPAQAMMPRIGMLVLSRCSGQAGGREYGDEGRGGREAELGGGGYGERPLRVLRMRMVLGNGVVPGGGWSLGATQRSKAVRWRRGRAHGA
jgi:hypothetical protein